MVRAPSVSTGTFPTGLIARHGGELRKVGEKSMVSISTGRPSSKHSQIGRSERVPGTW